MVKEVRVMTFKAHIDIPSLFAAINTCAGDVCFCTEAGDRLDLKSQLTRFLFLTVSQDEDAISTGRVELTDFKDIAKIESFLR